MGQENYLIDSNAVIDYLGNKFPAGGMQFMNTIVDATPAVSVITKIEVLGFNAPPEHYNILLGFMSDATVIDLVPAVIDQSIALRKLHNIKLPHAIIAATAIVNATTLVTRNTKDFDAIQELKTIHLHDIV